MILRILRITGFESGRARRSRYNRTAKNKTIRIIASQNTKDFSVMPVNMFHTGIRIFSFRNPPKNSNRPISSTKSKTNTISISISRSMITVPKSLSAGIFSVRDNTPQRVISPIRGKAKLARYPTIIELKVFFKAGLYPRGSIRRFHRIALEMYARLAKSRGTAIHPYRASRRLFHRIFRSMPLKAKKSKSKANPRNKRYLRVLRIDFFKES